MGYGYYKVKNAHLLKQIFESFRESVDTIEKCYTVLEQNYGKTNNEQDEAFASLWFNISGIKDDLKYLEENHGKR